MVIIETKKLEKKYNKGTPAEVHALKNINLQVNKGELLGIIGVSGSGKSTLLHILGCIDTVTVGKYYLNGEEIAKKSDRELARIRNQKVGFVLQEYGLLLNKTAIENVSLPLLFGDTRFKKIKEKCLEILDELGIKELGERQVNQLSGGQKQRVAIARALVNNPDIILADEPSGALDTDTAEEIMEVLVELNEKGKTIIAVTHDPVVVSYCKRILSLKDGRLEKINKDENLYRVNPDQ